jgi:hypothetical protein
VMELLTREKYNNFCHCHVITLYYIRREIVQ